MLNPEVIDVLRELNPWWDQPGVVKPEPPHYRRRAIRDMAERLRTSGRLVESFHGPRQVGKTTGLHQIIQDLLRASVPARDILFVRFDLEILREVPGSLSTVVRWFSEQVGGRPLGSGERPFLFLDEIHKIRRWDEEVKHLVDTYPVRLVITGSSSILVARGGRESLAGRVFHTEIPTFQFREVLEAWTPELVEGLPLPVRFNDIFEREFLDVVGAIERTDPARKSTLAQRLDSYFLRGGYPRLHAGEIDEDRRADYVTQTVFESVLGADIPDIMPVQDPRLLRHLYLCVARRTGTEIPQLSLVEEATAAGYRTTQPTVGRYLRMLADSLLIREFRRYPLTRRASARVPSKFVLADLGVRNAILRGTPSLANSDPGLLGPLVETLVQGVIRDANLQVHFWRDFEVEGNRKSPVREVDFVAERSDGSTLPVEVKYRKRIDPGEDSRGLRLFLERFQSPCGVMVTRDLHRWDEEARILYVPLQTFLLAF